MDKFYQLVKPEEHTDVYNRPVWWVGAAVVDEVLYLHNDGKVKDGMIHLGNPCTTIDFTSLDRAYLAINDYYVAHGQETPFVRVGGSWVVCDGAYKGYGQTTKSVLPSPKADDSQPMEFE